MANDTNRLLEYEIYPKLNHELIFNDLDGFKRQGKGYIATCPNCKKPAHFYMYDNKPVGFCYSCHYAVNYWGYLQTTGNLSDQETLIELSKRANYTLPKDNGVDMAKVEASNRKGNILEPFLKVCQDELKKSEKAKAYLEKRGFTLEEALELGIGFYSSPDTIKKSITNIINIDGLLYKNWTNRIIGLWRNKAGIPINVWGRTIDPKEARKYNYLEGQGNKYSPFGLESCKTKDLIAVEGILDALSLRKHGFDEVIALGGSQIAGEQLEALKRAKTEQITLNLDNDPAGFTGIEGSVAKLEAEGIRTYVIEPSLMGEVKDPDGYIAKNSIDAYKDLLKKARRGVEWIIERLAQTYDAKTSKGQDSLLVEGVRFINGINDKTMFDKAIKKLASTLNMPVEIIAGKCLDEEAKQKQEANKREYERLLSEAKDGRIDTNDLIVRLQDLRASTGQADITDLSTFLDEKKARDDARTEELLGYKLTKFKRLCKHIDGLQTGYYLIAGDTNTGKTAFVVNLFLDAIQTNPDISGLYFSLDDNKEIIVNRLLAIMTGLMINQTQTTKYLSNQEAEKRENEYKKLKVLADTGRFYLEDITAVDSVIALENYISTITKTGKKIFVIIDGLYNLAVSKDTEGIRGENIERANRIKALVDTYKIPIICTGELRKKNRGEGKDTAPTIDDLMETGKFSYNANLVLLLHQSQEEREKEIATLKCTYAKNKLNYYKGTEELNFKRKTSQIEETEQTAFNK